MATFLGGEWLHPLFRLIHTDKKNIKTKSCILLGPIDSQKRTQGTNEKAVYSLVLFDDLLCYQDFTVFTHSVVVLLLAHNKQKEEKFK